MEHKFPCPIVNEKDLNYYDEYLKKCECNENECEMRIEKSGAETRDILLNPAFMPGYLKCHIGKLVRVESLIGGCLERRTGTLMQVGTDYLVLKLYQGCSTMVCEASSIKYITIIHDNDINKAGLF